MKLELYVETLERTVANIPGVSAELDTLPQSILSFYREELTMLLAMENSAREEAESIGRTDLSKRIEFLSKSIRSFRGKL